MMVWRVYSTQLAIVGRWSQGRRVDTVRSRPVSHYSEGMTNQCPHCGFANVPGRSTCQLCGTQLPVVVCGRCNFINPSGYLYCGQCGQILTESTVPAQSPREPAVFTSVPPDRPSQNSSQVTSPLALIGFGAILALASAAYPWYFFGWYRGPEDVTLTQILEKGWSWFPGIPLVLIIISTIISSFVALTGKGRNVTALIAVGSGLITLLAAAWLWQSYPQPLTGVTNNDIVQAAGPMLAVVGGIIIIATGLWIYQRSHGS